MSALTLRVVSESLFQNCWSLGFVKQCLGQCNSVHCITHSISSERVQLNRTLCHCCSHKKVFVNLSQPKTHFVFSPAANPFPAVSSAHIPMYAHNYYLNRLEGSSCERCFPTGNIWLCRGSHLWWLQQLQTVTWKASKQLSILPSCDPSSCVLVSCSFDSKQSALYLMSCSTTIKEALRKRHLYLFWKKMKMPNTLS